MELIIRDNNGYKRDHTFAFCLVHKQVISVNIFFVLIKTTIFDKNGFIVRTVK